LEIIHPIVVIWSKDIELSENFGYQQESDVLYNFVSHACSASCAEWNEIFRFADASILDESGWIEFLWFGPEFFARV
jgi:hypothetical protein